MPMVPTLGPEVYKIGPTLGYLEPQGETSLCATPKQDSEFAGIRECMSMSLTGIECKILCQGTFEPLVTVFSLRHSCRVLA